MTISFEDGMKILAAARQELQAKPAATPPAVAPHKPVLSADQAHAWQLMMLITGQTGDAVGRGGHPLRSSDFAGSTAEGSAWGPIPKGEGVAWEELHGKPVEAPFGYDGQRPRPGPNAPADGGQGRSIGAPPPPAPYQTAPSVFAGGVVQNGAPVAPPNPAPGVHGVPQQA